MRLDINYDRKCKNTNTWKLNNIFLNDEQVAEEIKSKLKKIPRNKWQWKYNNSNPMGCRKSSFKREVNSNTVIPQETRKTSNRQPDFTPKTTGKRRTEKPQS